MSSNVQFVLTVLEVTTALAGAILIPMILMSIAERRAIVDARVRLVPPILALGLAVWYAVVDTIGRTGFFRAGNSASAHFPMIALGVFVPMIVALLVLPRIPPLRLLVTDAAVQPLWIAVQSYRVVPGAIFLYLLLQHLLPAVFAVPAGTGDVLVGLSAFPTAIWMRKGRRDVAIAWNCLGLLDLIAAIGLGVMTSPGALDVIRVSPNTTAATVAPVVIIPTFIVPLCFWLHTISLRFLLARRSNLTISA